MVIGVLMVIGVKGIMKLVLTNPRTILHGSLMIYAKQILIADKEFVLKIS
jgi:hypothetical protein